MFVDVANAETTYHHELLEYCFSKKIMENIKKVGVAFTSSPVHSKTSPHLSSVLS